MSVGLDPVVSVVAPLHNDAGILDDFLAETHAVLRRHFRHYEIVFIDDASTDHTVAAASALLDRYDQVRLVRLSRSFGREVAITAGLDLAIGDVVVVMLPDSDPPELIPTMIRRCAAGAGVVFGVHAQRAGESWPVRLGSRLFYWLSRRLFGLDLPSHATQFRALSRQAVHAVAQIKDRHRSLWVSSAYIGYTRESLPYRPRSRSGARTGRRFFEGIGLAFSVIAGNTTVPLRLAGRAAFMGSLVGFLWLGSVAGAWLLAGRTSEGWTTLSALAAPMFAMMLAVLGVACEYLARLLDESRDRPLYYIRDERTSHILLDSAPHRNVLVDPPRVVRA
ncbi:MAG: glycosyltransferase family 2 protein [Nitrospirota bacterium]